LHVFLLVGWSLVSIFNINGIDGREDFDLVAADHDKIDWNFVVMEEHTHEFHQGESFDANDISYRVCNHLQIILSLKSSNMGLHTPLTWMRICMIMTRFFL